MAIFNAVFALWWRLVRLEIKVARQLLSGLNLEREPVAVGYVAGALHVLVVDLIYKLI